MSPIILGVKQKEQKFRVGFQVGRELHLFLDWMAEKEDSTVSEYLRNLIRKAKQASTFDQRY